MNPNQGIIKKENSVRKMKKSKSKNTLFIIALALPFLVAIAAVFYMVFLNDKNVKAQADDKDTSSKIITEITNEQQVLDQQKRQLEDYERNLKSFEAELDRKYTDYLIKEKELKDKEEVFDKKVEDKTVDRQLIETYENIDPEQAAILIKNLYGKDPRLATLIMRKIAGKKAGKILEAMIPLDKDASTALAKEVMDFYKSK
jgi:flagellar motility protein MotE (MotC chaperone)